MRFFQDHGLGTYVREGFEPSIISTERVTALDPVSYYVLGLRQVSLIEPILVTASSWRSDVSHTNTRFLAYSAVKLDDYSTDCHVFVLKDGSRKARHEALELLESSRAKVYDLADERRARALRDDLVAVALSAS